jgi:hypothetical protein
MTIHLIIAMAHWEHEKPEQKEEHEEQKAQLC